MTIQMLMSNLSTLPSNNEIDSGNFYLNPFDFGNRRLEIGQWMDVKDTIDQWLEAQVMNVRGTQAFIHYNGWGTRWDEWIDMNSSRISVYRTYTVQSQHSVFNSPFPISRPDGDTTNIRPANLNLDDFLYDLGFSMNKINSLLIDLAKYRNMEKLDEIEEKERQ